MLSKVAFPSNSLKYILLNIIRSSTVRIVLLCERKGTLHFTIACYLLNTSVTPLTCFLSFQSAHNSLY